MSATSPEAWLEIWVQEIKMQKLEANFLNTVSKQMRSGKTLSVPLLIGRMLRITAETIEYVVLYRVVWSNVIYLQGVFNALYVQGALGSDAVLAGAIWRNIFDMKCTDVSHLELLVDYTRRQVNLHTVI